MPLVLAIEPDLKQAAILKRIVREQVRADLVLVESREAAISAIDAQLPDVILVTALLSPRDEEELIAHLRPLTGAEHLQTHTIPQLASGRVQEAPGGGLFGKFRKKKDAEAPLEGFDPRSVRAGNSKLPRSGRGAQNRDRGRAATRRGIRVP